MLLLLIFAGLLFQGSVSQITSHGNKTAEYGRDAYYSCEIANPNEKGEKRLRFKLNKPESLMKQGDTMQIARALSQLRVDLADSHVSYQNQRVDKECVLQVTWQRLFGDDSIENLASFSKRFGEQVNQPYLGKVVFTEASLSSTSITVKNVTWEDEGCYICSFNIYPEGSQRRQRCLTVQGISHVETKGFHPNSSELKGDEEEVEVEVSCSATGKPAPTIRWRFPFDATQLEKPTKATIRNGGRTFTSSSNITLKVPSDWSGYVDCVLNEGAMGQRLVTVPFSFGEEEEEKKEEKVVKRLSQSGIALVISSTVFIVFIVAAVALKRQRLKKNKRNENV